MCDYEKKLINRLCSGILLIEKSAASDTETKESNTIKKIKRMIEREVEK